MREDEFKAWLGERGANTQAGRNTRAYAVRTMESNLGALGSPHADLDAAWVADRFEQLRQRIKDIQQDFRAGGTDYRILMPQSEKPEHRLASWRSWLGQYGQFLDGTDSTDRQNAALQVFVNALTRKEIDAAIELCDDEGLEEFLETRGCRPPQRWIALENSERHYPAKATVIAAVSALPNGMEVTAKTFFGGYGESEAFTCLTKLGYTLVDFQEKSDTPARENARDADLIRSAILRKFIYPARRAGNSFIDVTLHDVVHSMDPKPNQPNARQVMDGKKLQKMGGISNTKVDDPEDYSLARSYRYELDLSLDLPPLPTPIWIVTARWGTEDGMQRFVDHGEWSLLTDTGSANNDRIRQMQPGDRIVMRDYFHQSRDLPFEANGARISAIRIRAMGTVTEQRGDGLSVGVAWDTPLRDPRVWYFYTQNDPVWRLKEPGESPFADMLRGFLTEEVPQDYDYFLKHWFGQKDPSAVGAALVPSPTNLVLYGPPGTGKTHNSALEAVALCDGEDARDRYHNDRSALMARYRELEGQGRIRLVTFHQNFSYEEFVEGLRPVVSEGGHSGAGFGLEVKPGIFREICAVAEQARKNPGSATSESPSEFEGRAFWKMSVGSSRTEDDVYEAAVNGDYIALGWGGDEDWSDPSYSSEDAIRAHWQSIDRPSTEPSNWTQTHRFRNVIKRGDLVIVPYGNTAFRGIAEVTGDYRHDADAEGYFAQRRDVKWLVNLDEPLPLDTIIDGNFTMRTLYSLPAHRIKMPALERLIASGRDPSNTAPVQTTPDQFVLIIDEINRANISKVFGELITLIEPGKRLGQEPNALTARLPYSRREFGVPVNLHIIGTMNTADRSIALLDTALRRRFTFREVAPKPELLGTVEGIDLTRVLTTINQRIEYLIDREHRIGHAFFIHCETRNDVNAVMRDKVIPLLQEYFFEDWSRIAAVVGPGFIKKGELKAPPGLGDLQPRPTWSVLAEFPHNAYDALLGGAAVSTTEGEATSE